jgi:enoyl-CoA hydratase/carnithine racemase
LHPALHRLATAPVPVVAALNGPVGGAGIGLALCADFVLAAASMKLRTGYAAIGLSPDLGTAYFLARRVGAVRAQQWLMLVVHQRIKRRAGGDELADVATGAEGAAPRRQQQHARRAVEHLADGMRQHLAGRTRQRVGPIDAPQLDAADGAGYAPGDALF